jgi:hypothetical protein
MPNNLPDARDLARAVIDEFASRHIDATLLGSSYEDCARLMLTHRDDYGFVIVPEADSRAWGAEELDDEYEPRADADSVLDDLGLAATPQEVADAILRHLDETADEFSAMSDRLS